MNRRVSNCRMVDASSPIKKVSIAALFCFSSLTGSANAQQGGAKSIKVGETRVIPTFRIDYVSVDNSLNTSDNFVESTGLVVSPSVSWEAEKKSVDIKASYSGAFGSYSESILDFNDHDLTLRVNADLGTRHQTFGSFSVSKRRQLLGTGQTTFATNVSEQLVTTNVTLNAGYTFGASTAKGKLGAGLQIGTQTYNDVGSITAGDDNTRISPYAFFSYRLSPDTRWITRVNFRLTDYDEDRRDRTEVELLTGISLAATARSGGNISFGVSQADYDIDGISDTSQIISDVSVYFNPKSYSSFNLTFSRSLVTVDDSDTGSGASLVNSGDLTWRHDWTTRFSTSANVRGSQIQRECPNNDSAVVSAGLEFDLKVSRWLSAGAGVSSSIRSAVLCNDTIAEDEFDAEQTTFSIHLTGSL